MALSLKPGVSLVGIDPAMVIGATIVVGVYDKFGVACVITSALDGQHSETSLHYVGHALDFRTRDLSADEQAYVAKECKARLGLDFDVVLESDHLHVELQARRAPTEPLTA
jgi:hypothetical protein